MVAVSFELKTNDTVGFASVTSSLFLKWSTTEVMSTSRAPARVMAVSDNGRTLGEKALAFYAIPHELTHYVVAWLLGMNPTYHFWEMEVECEGDLTEHPRRWQVMNLAPFLLLPLVYPIRAGLVMIGVPAGFPAQFVALAITLTLALPSGDDSGAAQDLSVIATADDSRTCECERCGGEAESFVKRTEVVYCDECTLTYDPDALGDEPDW